MNPAIDHQWRKWNETDPSYDAGDPNSGYATRIVIKGHTYWNPPTRAPRPLPVFPSRITVTIYPGMDNMQDFNVKRNHSYDIELNINDLTDDEDKRVVIDTDPFVQYVYLYETDEGHVPFAVDYHDNVSLGEYTVSDYWKNLYKDRIPDTGNTFQDGRASDETWEIEENMSMAPVIYIFYDKVGAGPDWALEITDATYQSNGFFGPSSNGAITSYGSGTLSKITAEYTNLTLSLSTAPTNVEKTDDALQHYTLEHITGTQRDHNMRCIYKLYIEEQVEPAATAEYFFTATGDV